MDWDRFIAGFLVTVGVCFLLLGVYAVWVTGFSPKAKTEAAIDLAFKTKCLDHGLVLIPTQRYHIKGQPLYSGWICARIEVIDP
jgi:cbb3-type cytochrome oxidase subunit 3